MDKVAPIRVTQLALQTVENKIEDVYPDPIAEQVFSELQQPLKTVEKQFAAMLQA
jgi:hypothetical protein